MRWVFLPCHCIKDIGEGFYFFVVLWLHLAYSESAPRSFNYLWGLYRVKNSTMWDVILNQIPKRTKYIKIFCLPNRKISLCLFYLCAKWVKSCPNPEKTALDEKKFRSFLSILDRMKWAKEASHATVPLSLKYHLIPFPLKSLKNNFYVQLNKHFSVHLPDEDRHK